MTTIYCLDSGVFIRSWRVNYPPEIFPCVWDCLQKLCTSRRAIIPQAVYEELEKGGDEVFQWVKDHVSMAVRDDSEDVVHVMKEIMLSHGRLVDSKKNRSAADPWVIAHARVAGAVVVTEEEPSHGKSPKIPDVCTDYGVTFMRTVDLLKVCKVVAR